MVRLFRSGLSELRDVWEVAPQPRTVNELVSLEGLEPRKFPFPDELWVKVVYEFAATYHRRSMNLAHLLRSLTPLYLARVASFVVETQESLADEVEEKIERLCQIYEEQKPYLIVHWPARFPPPATSTCPS